MSVQGAAVVKAHLPPFYPAAGWLPMATAPTLGRPVAALRADRRWCVVWWADGMAGGLWVSQGKSGGIVGYPTERLLGWQEIPLLPLDG